MIAVGVLMPGAAALLAAVSVLLIGAITDPDHTQHRYPAGAEVPAARAPSGGLVLSGGLPAWAQPVMLITVGVVSVLVLGPVAGLVLVGALAVVRSTLERRVQARRLAERDRAVPDLIDLFAIAASAGHPVHRCVEVVTPRSPLVLRASLLRTLDRLDVGVPLRRSLTELGEDLGPLGATLTEALSASLVTGAPLGVTLADVAAAARDQRRREAEIQARRLPVQLLLPLVGCILPAFALLAVVPLLAGSLGSLDTSP